MLPKAGEGLVSTFLRRQGLEGPLGWLPVAYYLQEVKSEPLPFYLPGDYPTAQRDRTHPVLDLACPITCLVSA